MFYLPDLVEAGLMDENEMLSLYAGSSFTGAV